MINTILLDMYGVILREGDGNFLPFVHTYFPNARYEDIYPSFGECAQGGITSDQLFAAIGFRGDLGAVMHEYLDYFISQNPDFPTAAKKLSARYRLAVLSNDAAEWSRYLCKKFSLYNYIPRENMFISGDTGFRKPDLRAYQNALAKLACAPEECLFTDDRPRNLYPAREMGIKTVLFDSSQGAYGTYDGAGIANLSELIEYADKENS